MRKLRPRKQHSKLRKIVLYMQAAVMLFFGVGIGAAVGTFVSVSRMLPRITDYSPPEVTKIYSSDNVLLATIGQENREFVKYDKIPKNLINAAVAIEDSRFYEHVGVDFKGIARAMVKNVRGGGMLQGGSTITQQLVRNVYLTPKKNMSRKIREAVLAIIIERRYTKPKILELYLNQVYFGSSSYGVEAASKIYFGKNVNNLDLAECALIAGLPQAPSSYSPHTDLEKAVERRNIVLERMAELHYITPEQAEEAKAEKPHIVALRPTKYRSLAPYFTDYVKKYLRDEYKYDDALVQRGGLRVYTTVNYKMQVAAQEALAEGVARAKAVGQMEKSQGNGALICIEPGTGYIKAMVGGADYTKSEFNRTVQSERQPGSSFKAFVYTAAVDMLGWKPDQYIRCGNGHIYWPLPDGTTWSPKNYDGKYYSGITMERAVARSVNVAAAVTAKEVGIENVIKYARLLGITSEIEAYPATSIGGLKRGLRPVELAAAYAVFASGGYYAKPTPIAKILDSDGNLVEERSIDKKLVLKEETVKVMDQLFRAVVSPGGTAYGAIHTIADARGKTGTTNNDADAWFVGYVPNKLVTAVWMGNDDRIPMRKVYGGTVCGPVWRQFMQVAIPVYQETRQKQVATKPATKPQPTANADKPKNETHTQPTPNEDNPTPNENVETASDTIRVRVCNDSGLLATRWCSSTHWEDFVKGAEPTGYCNIHGPRNGDSGGDSQPSDNTSGGDNNLRLTPPPPINDR